MGEANGQWSHDPPTCRKNFKHFSKLLKNVVRTSRKILKIPKDIPRNEMNHISKKIKDMKCEYFGFS